MLTCLTTDETAAGGMVITDMTETNVTKLRHTIYLTIMSSITFEECAHKLLKMTIKPGQEVSARRMCVVGYVMLCSTSSAT